MNQTDKLESVVKCHLCDNKISTKKTHIISVDYEYFGTKGKMLVDICKECYRNNRLNKLGI